MNEIIQADVTAGSQSPAPETTGSAVVVTRTGPEWASIIRNDLNRAVEGIITAGQHLTEAKSDVNHGEWVPMLNGIGISQPHAYKLMQIGERFSNHSYRNDLPSSIAALYELSQLDPEGVEHGVEDGVIHPDMTAQDAKDMNPGSKESSAFDKAMKNLKAFSKNASTGLTPAEREALATEAVNVLRKVGGPSWKH